MDIDALVTEMIRVQQKHGLSDRAFADRLGISHSYWTMLRLGKRRPGRKFLVGILKAFSFYESDVIACLKGMEG